MRLLIHKPHNWHGNAEKWAPGRRVSSWLQLWNTPQEAYLEGVRGSHAHKLHQVWMVTWLKLKTKFAVFANWKFHHIHTERFRKSVSISSSFKRCCSEDDPPDCLTIPTLNGGNGWHKSALHVLQEAGPSLWTSLRERDRQGKKKEKKKKFPLSCRLTLNQFTFHTAAAWGGGWIRLLTRPQKKKPF